MQNWKRMPSEHSGVINNRLVTIWSTPWLPKDATTEILTQRCGKLIVYHVAQARVCWILAASKRYYLRLFPVPNTSRGIDSVSQIQNRFYAYDLAHQKRQPTYLPTQESAPVLFPPIHLPTAYLEWKSEADSGGTNNRKSNPLLLLSPLSSTSVGTSNFTLVNGRITAHFGAFRPLRFRFAAPLVKALAALLSIALDLLASCLIVWPINAFWADDSLLEENEKSEFLLGLFFRWLKSQLISEENVWNLHLARSILVNAGRTTRTTAGTDRDHRDGWRWWRFTIRQRNRTSTTAATAPWSTDIAWTVRRCHIHARVVVTALTEMEREMFLRIFKGWAVQKFSWVELFVTLYSESCVRVMSRLCWYAVCKRSCQECLRPTVTPEKDK